MYPLKDTLTFKTIEIAKRVVKKYCDWGQIDDSFTWE